MRLSRSATSAVLAVAAVTAAAVSVPQASAQTPPAGPSTVQPTKSWGLWLTLALAGRTTLGGNGGVLAVSYQRNAVMFAGRLTISDDGGPPCNELCTPDAYDLGVVVSLARPVGRTFQLSAGAGLAGGQYRSGPGRVTIPIEVRLDWRALRWLGFGAYGWGSTVGPHGGVAVAVNLGRLR